MESRHPKKNPRDNWFKSLFREKAPSEQHIGQVLVEKGIITPEQLETALKTQKERLIETGQAVRLGHIITVLGFAPEEVVVHAINEGFRISVASLSDNIRELIARQRGTLAQRLPTPRIPIWLKLSVGALLIISVTVFSFSFYIIEKQKERLFEQTVKVGTVSINYFVNNARIPLLDEDILRLNTLIKDATDTKGFLYAVISDTREKIMAHTDIERIGEMWKGFTKPSPSVRKGDIIYFSYFSPVGQNILNLTRQVVFRGKNLGHVHVGISLDFIDQLVDREIKSILVMTVTLTFIGLAVAVVLGIRFSKPILSLVTATEEIGKGNYKHRVNLSRNDELGNLATAFNRMGDELFRHSLTRESFGKYVGADVLELILADPEKMWLKGRRNEATIVFADIRGFTTYSYEKEPEFVVEMLNQYFDIATRSILDFGGYIDKFIGDGVLAVFGVPVFRKDHVERAVRAALELIDRLHRQSDNDNDILSAVGIGIHTGVVVSGNIGSEAKMEYTVIGDTVNVASRISGLAGPGEVLVTGAVHNAIKDLVVSEPPVPRAVKGKKDPIDTYRITRIRESAHVHYPV